MDELVIDLEAFGVTVPKPTPASVPHGEVLKFAVQLSPEATNNGVRLARLIREVEIRHYALPFFGLEAWISQHTVELVLNLRTLDRESGFPSHIVWREQVPQLLYMRDAAEATEYLSRIVRHCLHKLLTHEVDECLYVGGARLFDPHKTEKPTSP